MACIATGRPMAAEQLHARAAVVVRLQHMRRPCTDGAVEKGLDRADAHAVRAEAGDDLDLLDRVELLGRERARHAQRHTLLDIELLPRGSTTAALEVVQAREAKAMRLLLAEGNGTLALGTGGQGERGRPGGVLSADGVTTDLRDGGGAEPEGVTVARPEGSGSPTGRGVEQRGWVGHLGEHRLGPAGADQPCVVRGRCAIGGRLRCHQFEGGRRRRSMADVHAQPVERPRQEVHVRIDEARDDGATPEIDALVGDLGGIALPGLDAPCDASTIIDGQAPHVRQGGIGRVDGAAFEDHARQGR
jgi:hypothetical protein